MTDPQGEARILPCWYVKDFADGWIKFYDVDMAIREAMHTGATMVYSITGAKPFTPRTPAIADGVGVERMKKDMARAALCILENPYGAIADTVWLSEGYMGGTTLYEHLIGYVDAPIEGTTEEQMDALRKYIGMGEYYEPEWLKDSTPPQAATDEGV